MNFSEIKNVLFAAAKAEGLTEYDVYYRVSTDISAEALNGEPSAASFGAKGGVTFRCAVDGKIGAASGECLTEQELMALVPRAMANAALIDADEEPIFYAPQAGDLYERVTAEMPEMPEMQDLRRAAMTLQEKVYAATPLAADGTESGVGGATVTVALANSKGLDLTHTAAMHYAVVEAVVNRDGEPSFGYARSNNFDEASLSEMTDRAVGDALARLGAGALKTGKYHAVFSAKQMRALLGTYAGIFNGKNALLGLSLLGDKVGTEIAAPAVSLYDDPFYAGNTMQMPFDAEGVPTVRKALIEKGVLKTLLYDLTTAKKAGRTTTGNAARGSYAAPVSISPFCLAFGAGNKTLAELFSFVGEGVYITELKGLHAGCDATTGDFSIEAAGFLIKDGKQAAPVRSFTIAGNFYEMLKNITEIGSEVEEGGSGFSMTAAPAVSVKDISVAGEA
ncbi:MAG: TldD/PmbA family protein [Clostridia bacterium]|nr:TldD/PmbA family protein [Clostridia bacterium]